jgi:hypothetical protein
MSDKHASLYDFRDTDIMHRLAENTNGTGIPTPELAGLLGFEEGDNRAVSIRMAWMRRYGMVLFDEKDRLWSLSGSGQKVVNAHLRAPTLKIVERLPDETMVEVMAQVTSRYMRGEPMLAHMLRREFLYGTKPR